MSTESKQRALELADRLSTTLLDFRHAPTKAFFPHHVDLIIETASEVPDLSDMYKSHKQCLKEARDNKSDISEILVYSYSGGINMLEALRDMEVITLKNIKE